MSKVTYIGADQWVWDGWPTHSIGPKGPSDDFSDRAVFHLSTRVGCFQVSTVGASSNTEAFAESKLDLGPPRWYSASSLTPFSPAGLYYNTRVYTVPSFEEHQPFFCDSVRLMGMSKSYSSSEMATVGHLEVCHTMAQDLRSKDFSEKMARAWVQEDTPKIRVFVNLIDKTLAMRIVSQPNALRGVGLIGTARNGNVILSSIGPLLLLNGFYVRGAYQALDWDLCAITYSSNECALAERFSLLEAVEEINLGLPEKRLGRPVTSSRITRVMEELKKEVVDAG